MTQPQDAPKPPQNWRALGWKSEQQWREAHERITAKHKALAKAAGIPWEAPK